jgi:hypothetical protein
VEIGKKEINLEVEHVKFRIILVLLFVTLFSMFSGCVGSKKAEMAEPWEKAKNLKPVELTMYLPGNPVYYSHYYGNQLVNNMPKELNKRLKMINAKIKIGNVIFVLDPRLNAHRRDACERPADAGRAGRDRPRHRDGGLRPRSGEVGSGETRVDTDVARSRGAARQPGAGVAASGRNGNAAVRKRQYGIDAGQSQAGARHAGRFRQRQAGPGPDGARQRPDGKATAEQRGRVDRDAQAGAGE